jgi:hypothetical protein
MRYIPAWSLVLACGLASCSFNRDRDYANVSIRVPGRPQAARVFDPILGSSMGVAPTTVSLFDCLGVNVIGPGIQPPAGHHLGDFTFEALYAGDSCAYPGISAVFPNSATDTKILLKVPSGKGRVVQIAGIVAGGTSVCSTGNFNDTEEGWEAYEVGRAVTDLFRDMAVSVRSTYDSLTSAEQQDREMACGSGSNVDYGNLIFTTPSLVGYWRFGETSGAVADDAANGSIGDMTYTVGVALGQDGPGSSSSVGLGPGLKVASLFDYAGFGNEFTFEIWFKGTSCNGLSKIFNMRNSGSGNRIGIGCSGNTAAFTATDNAATSQTVIATTSIIDGAWHHLVGTKDTLNSIRIYIDGQEESSNSAAYAAGGFPFTGGPHATEIGYDTDATGYMAGGNYSEAAIYARALTAAEIQSHYDALNY